VADFFDQEMGRDWRERLRDLDFWNALDRVPDDRYWVTSQSVKSRMLASVRERLQREYARKGMSPAQLRHVTRFLDPTRPDVLTIGFARRFATYKRATLLLRDRARLVRICATPSVPSSCCSQASSSGRRACQAGAARSAPALTAPGVPGHIIFLEDYDLQLARWLVSGVDVWLNNPLRRWRPAAPRASRRPSTAN